MTWDSIKKYLVIIVVIVVVEAIRLFTGLPITPVDVLLTPASIFLMALGIRYLIFTKQKRVDDDAPYMSQSIWQLSGNLIVLIGLIMLGLWCVYDGLQDPLEFFTSVKGSGHGYTLVCLGSLLVGYGLYFSYKLLIRIKNLWFQFGRGR